MLSIEAVKASSRVRCVALLSCLALVAGGCRREAAQPQQPAARAQNVLIITIDTLRADRVGAYGYQAARTPAIDALAARGVRFEHAYAAAPITLTSHASLLTGRYPPGHGARDNGVHIDASIPTIAETLSRAGFDTAAFIAAFPLDRRFGLNKGFRTYSDRMPPGQRGRPASERPGRVVADEAIAWLNEHRAARFFVWVHFFEPHAPYGNPSDRRPVAERYDDEIAEADRQVGRVVEALGSAAASTLIVLASDHGEAFGEHGEIAHSIFVYDTTLRVPLVVSGPGISARVVSTEVGLVDVAPTVIRLLGAGPFDADGVDLSDALAGGTVAPRDLYAESFAPLLDFGWSPLRALRSEGFKYIAAPKPELYRVAEDSAEQQNLIDREPRRAAALNDRVGRMSAEGRGARAGGRGPAAGASKPNVDPEAAARLQALGYIGGGRDTPDNAARPDPKDRRELAARIAQVTSGELEGATLERALEDILKEDPRNPQAQVRLGYVQLEANRCAEAERHFRAAIAARLPSADAHLGLAACEAAARRFDAAAATLKEAEAVEPDNPVVVANRGVVISDGGRPLDAIPHLQRALALDPEFHEARFNLAIAFARAGRRADAAHEAEELLRRLPPDAPQRPEVGRLLEAVR